MTERQTEHTPGPWQFDGNPEFGYTIYAERTEGRITRRLEIGHSHGGKVAGIADATLIAAAPALLAACEAVADWEGKIAWAMGADDHKSWDAVRDAQAKALEIVYRALAKAKGVQ